MFEEKPFLSSLEQIFDISKDVNYFLTLCVMYHATESHSSCLFSLSIPQYVGSL
jgi:hypothetical protein